MNGSSTHPKTMSRFGASRGSPRLSLTTYPRTMSRFGASRVLFAFFALSQNHEHWRYRFFGFRTILN